MAVSLNFLLFVMATIVQWNIRGFRANFEELSLLCNKHQPSVVALQETLLKKESNVSFKSYHVFNKFSDSGNAVGGAALLVKNGLLFSEVTLNTPLQAVAVRVSLDKTITFCSIYLPPSDNILFNDLDNLLDQLPTPYVLIGDFNGHCPLWGSDHYNNRGHTLEKLFSDRNLCVLNNGEATYCHPASGSLSCLDLTVCHPSLVLDFEWDVLDDSHGSDHFPTRLVSVGTHEESSLESWILKKADWAKYHFLCNSRITEDLIFNGSDEPCSVFSRILIELANECVPKRPFTLGKVKVPWFNDNCRKALQECKRSKRKFFKYPVWTNNLVYKQSRAKVRRVLKQSRKESWRNFCSKLNSKTKSAVIWKAIKKIKGKRGRASINHLKVNGKLVTDKTEVANVIAETIELNSSSNNYNDSFKSIKQTAESKPLKFQSDNLEPYNIPFTILELRQALQKCNNSTPGMDNIHYRFFN